MGADEETKYDVSEGVDWDLTDEDWGWDGKPAPIQTLEQRVRYFGEWEAQVYADVMARYPDFRMDFVLDGLQGSFLEFGELCGIDELAPDEFGPTSGLIGNGFNPKCREIDEQTYLNLAGTLLFSIIFEEAKEAGPLSSGDHSGVSWGIGDVDVEARLEQDFSKTMQGFSSGFSPRSRPNLFSYQVEPKKVYTRLRNRLKELEIDMYHFKQKYGGETQESQLISKFIDYLLLKDYQPKVEAGDGSLKKAKCRETFKRLWKLQERLCSAVYEDRLDDEGLQKASSWDYSKPPSEEFLSTLPKPGSFLISAYKSHKKIEPGTGPHDVETITIMELGRTDDGGFSLVKALQALGPKQNWAYGRVTPAILKATEQHCVEVGYRDTLAKMESVVDEHHGRSSRLSSARERIREHFPDITERHIDYIIREELFFAMNGGQNSGVVASSPTLVAKQAEKGLNADEARVYNWNLGQFELVRPSLREIIELGDSSLLVTTNANFEMPGYAKMGMPSYHNRDGSLNVHRFIHYNLFLMGLFHKEATRAALESDETFVGNERRYSRGGIAHSDALIIPTSTSEASYKDIRSSISGNSVSNICGVVESFRNYVRETGLSVIHGDWKTGSLKLQEASNIVNGHIIDYSFVSWGQEVEDVAFFLSEADFGLSQADVRKYLGDYIAMRSEHDQNFAVDKAKHAQMNKTLDSGLMASLTRYNSIMNKRGLDNDPRQLDRRLKYAHQANEQLQQGLRTGFI